MSDIDKIAAEAADTIIAVNGQHLMSRHEIADLIKSAIEKDREYRRDVLDWEAGYKCGKAQSKMKIEELETEIRSMKFDLERATATEGKAVKEASHE